MKNFLLDILKAFIPILFIAIFMVFLLVTALKFEILNYSFLTNSLASHQIYSKIPLILDSAANTNSQDTEAYSKIVHALKEGDIQNVLDYNLGSIISYINGQSNDLSIYFPLSKLGINSLTNSDYINITNLPNIGSSIKKVNGLGNAVSIIWILTLILLLILIPINFLLYETSKIRWTGILIFSAGLFTTLINVVVKLIINNISPILVSGKLPQQNAIGLVISSLGSDISTTWLIMTGATTLIGLILIFVPNFVKRFNHNI